MNVVQLVGTIHAAPTMRYTANGKPVATFVLRVPRRPTAFAHPQVGDACDDITIIAWDDLAGSVERSATIGRMVGVVGSIRRSTWSHDAGFERSKTEVQAASVYYLERRSAGPPQPTDDDIPF